MNRIGIDTGGTFTDVVSIIDGKMIVEKVSSTPSEPEKAVLSCLGDLRVPDTGKIVTYGSTVATNAILERKGARVALVTTEGFEDVIFIGRQNRPDIYDLHPRKPPALVSEKMVFGISGRIAPDGSELEGLKGLLDAARKVRTSDPEAVAVCLLHSYANPRHERAVGRKLGEILDGVPVSLSCDICPEHREYERTSTTLLNAYVLPVMERHLNRLKAGLVPARLRVVQSNGGSISAEKAALAPVGTVLSGPAGGVMGALRAARGAGYENVITFDMGGTSTDVSLCAGAPAMTGEYSIDGLPLRTRVIDIHTVGAGGGSIVRRDTGGGLRVGPASAGAVPGPVCYGRGGDRITVTDANLVLGRLHSGTFLGGRMELDATAARRAIKTMASEVGMDAIELAEGIVSMANSTMLRALGVISTRRGHDPRDFILVCYGGAGPLHACELAREQGIKRILVPAYPGVLSARGMVLADVLKDHSASFLKPLEEAGRGEIDDVFAALKERAFGEMEDEGFSEDQLVFERSVDLRYRGQGHELNVPYGNDIPSRFHAAHLGRYGHCDEGETVEIVNLRLSARGMTVKPPVIPAAKVADSTTEAAVLARKDLYFGGEYHEATVYDRGKLGIGAELPGPALVTEYSATTFIPPGFSASVDPYGGLDICSDPTR